MLNFVFNIKYLSEVLSSKWSVLLVMLSIEFIIWFIDSFISKICSIIFHNLQLFIEAIFHFLYVLFDFTLYTILYFKDQIKYVYF